MAKVIGFRPTEKDMERLEYLIETFTDKNPFARVSNSDVLRYALEMLYKQYEGDKKNA